MMVVTTSTSRLSEQDGATVCVGWLGGCVFGGLGIVGIPWLGIVGIVGIVGIPGFGIAGLPRM